MKIHRLLVVFALLTPGLAVRADPPDLVCVNGGVPVFSGSEWRCPDGSLALSRATLTAGDNSQTIGGGSAGVSFITDPDPLGINPQSYNFTLFGH